MWQKMPSAVVKKEDENKAHWMQRVLSLIVLALILLSVLILVGGPIVLAIVVFLAMIGFVFYKKVTLSKDDDYQKVE